jgi:uncharacterized membrane protein YdbT with pleckstrin-like domain
MLAQFFPWEVVVGYLESSVSGDEKVLGKFGVHWIAWIGPVVFSFVVVGIPSLLRLIGLEQGLTTRRLLVKRGIVSRKSEEIILSAVETVQIKQGILGRLLGYGDVELTGRGISGVTVIKTPSPLKVKNRIEEQISSARKFG